MVTEALVEACDQRHLCRHRCRHLSPPDLARQAVVEDVQLLVRLVELERLRVVADIGGGGGVPHLGRHLGHPLHDARATGVISVPTFESDLWAMCSARSALRSSSGKIRR